MGPHITTEILRAVVLGMILTILFGAIATWIWTIGRLLRGEPLLPETPLVPRREPPWGLGTILLILLAYVFVSHQAFVHYAPANRPDPPKEAVEAPAPVERPAAGELGASEANAKLEAEPGREPGAQPPAPPIGKEADSLPDGPSALELMTIQGAVNGIFILFLPLLARMTSGARLRDLGLVLRGWRQQAAVGIVAVLFLMPIVYSVQVACLKLLHMPDQEREKFKHPLEKMLRDNFSPGVASLAFLSAVILAPVFEELLFRGFVQSWLVKALERFGGWLRTLPIRLRRRPITILEQPAGPPSPSPSELALPVAPPASDAMFAAQSLAASAEADPKVDGALIGQDSPIHYWEAAEDDSKAAQSDDQVPETLEITDLRYQPRSTWWTGVAIILTSLIFAALHAAQWPAPVPLFLLAVGLGVVYQRTGSLIAPIFMHAVFNAFSTLMLFFVALQGPDKVKPVERPVLERVVPLEKTQPGVPGVDPQPQRGKT